MRGMASAPHPEYVLPETLALAILGLADLLYTSYLLATHQGWEGNPLMQRVLVAFGPTGLIVTKALLLAVPLAIVEWARARGASRTRYWLRAAVIAYASLWLWGTARFNRWL